MEIPACANFTLHIRSSFFICRLKSSMLLSHFLAQGTMAVRPPPPHQRFHQQDDEVVSDSPKNWATSIKRCAGQCISDSHRTLVLHHCRRTLVLMPPNRGATAARRRHSIEIGMHPKQKGHPAANAGGLLSTRDLMVTTFAVAFVGDPALSAEARRKRGAMAATHSE